MDYTNLSISTLFKIKNDNSIYKFIGYNIDKTQIFYISINDKIIYGNLKNCSIDLIDEINVN